MAGKPQTIDEYLATLSGDKRAALEKLRRTIKAAAPKAEECISYRLPAFRLEGRMLVAFGATANHCAFYPMSSSTVAAHEDELEGYDTSKGSIRFRADAPLPATLVRKLVRARVAERMPLGPGVAAGDGSRGAMQKVNLKDKLALFTDLWSPKAVGAVNDFHVKLVKLKGEFVWHSHEVEDELFLVLRGSLRMQFRDREVVVEPGELIVVPRRTDHRPVADEEVHVLLLEPKSTVNTGTAGGDRTREVEWI